MAITVVQQPQLYTPLYNDMPIILTGQTLAKFKQKYVIKVSFADVSVPFVSDIGTFKSEVLINDIYDSGAGYFNLKDALQYLKNFTSYSVSPFQKKCWPILVEYGEEYSDTASGAVTYYQTDDFGINVFNGAFPLTEFRQYDYTDLINTTTVAASSGIGIKTLTSIQSRNVLLSSMIAADYLINGNSCQAVVTYYNGATALGTQEITTANSFLFQTSAEISPYELTIPTNTTRYTVQLVRTSNGNPLSDVVEYILDEGCSQYEKVNVYYQNKYGAEDVFVFDKKSTKNTDIQREVYKTSYGLTNEYTRAGVNVYNSKVTTKHVLNTDWLTKDDYIALGELVESNNVFIQFDDGFVYGSKSQFTLTITKSQNNLWEILNTQVVSATKTGAVNLLLTLTPDSIIHSTAVDLYAAYEAVIAASNWATYFDIDSSGVNFDNLVLIFTAKQKGTSYNLTSFSDGDQTNVSGYTDGVDEVIPVRIPVKVENTTFDYKKEANLELYQIELTVTERLTYERQTQ